MEWLLCDPDNLAKVTSKKLTVRKRFYDKLTPEELACYNSVDDSGASYKDIEKQSLTKAMITYVRGGSSQN